MNKSKSVAMERWAVRYLMAACQSYASAKAAADSSKSWTRLIRKAAASPSPVRQRFARRFV